jgi:hypothetical protein
MINFNICCEFKNLASGAFIIVEIAIIIITTKGIAAVSNTNEIFIGIIQSAAGAKRKRGIDITFNGTIIELEGQCLVGHPRESKG